jgi:hypothetical protein
MRLSISLAAAASVLLIALFGAVVMVGAANLRSQASDDVTINGPVVTCIPVTPTPMVTPRPTRTPPGTHFLGTGLTIQGEFCGSPPTASPSPTPSPSPSPSPTVTPIGGPVTQRPTRTPVHSAGPCGCAAPSLEDPAAEAIDAGNALPAT